MAHGDTSYDDLGVERSQKTDTGKGSSVPRKLTATGAHHRERDSTDPMRAGALLALLLASAADLAAGVRAPGGVHPAWHPAVLHPGSSVPAAGSPERDRPADAPATATEDDDGAPSPASMPGRYPTAGYSPHNGSSAALRTRELPGCSLHVFRHVSKAAGTTVRFIFDKQVAMGDFEFLPMCHYGFREKDWREVVKRFKDAAVDPARIESGEGPRIIVEIRNEWGATRAFEDVVMRDLRELRATHSHLGCEISSSMLFRDPTQQYRSFYEYYIRKEQEKPRGPDQGAAAWGDSFAEWASVVPDLQLREALGDRCVPALRRPIYDTDPATGERRGERTLDETCKVTLGDRARFERIVADVDVVGVASEFDAFWLRLADVVGFQHLEYVRSNTKDRHGAGRRRRRREALAAADEALDADGGDGDDGDDDAAVVAATAPNDAWAHDLVRRTQASTWAGCDDDDAAGGATGAGSSTGREDGGYGCELRRRVNALRAASVEAKDGRTRVGGSPPRSVYMFARANPGRDENPVRAEHRARPGFYTSEPICKGFGTDLSALVRKDDARYECDRGCSFD
jgi:hypothetical protein